MEKKFKLTWANAVSEWNKAQPFRNDLYGIPKKGGEFYDEIREMMGIKPAPQKEVEKENESKKLVDYNYETDNLNNIDIEIRKIQRNKEYPKKYLYDDINTYIEEGIEAGISKETLIKNVLEYIAASDEQLAKEVKAALAARAAPAAAPMEDAKKIEELERKVRSHMVGRIVVNPKEWREASAELEKAKAELQKKTSRLRPL